MGRVLRKRSGSTIRRPDRWRALAENARAKTEGAPRWAEGERGRSRPVTLGFDLF